MDHASFPMILAGALLVLASAVAAGCLVAPRSPLPWAVRFTTGAAALSLLLLALLAAGAGYAPVYAALAAVLVGAAVRVRAASVPRLGRMPLAIAVLLGVASVIYALVALAPEVQPDAIAYHLRLARDFAATHRLGVRVAFYDVMPLGAQMLFVPAVSTGGYVAAKLVHFGFLLAMVPLMRHVAREFGVEEKPAAVGAALFFLAPVAAVDGTCAYVDMALVCASTATLYLLARWEKERGAALLFCAGLNAGFCYSVKQTFGLVAAVGLVYVAVRAPRVRAVGAFASGAALGVAPWVLRAWLLTGNPVAPFLNRVFPNEASTAQVEKTLTGFLAIWSPAFSWARALPSYTFRGGHQGLLGVAFLLLPAAVFALRRREGRWLLGSAAVLALPLAVNTGTRFALPALAPAAIALAMVLPARAGVALVMLQALAALPVAMDRYESSGDWRLHEIPWRAALGLEGESDFLARRLREMPAVKAIEEHTPPGTRVVAFTGVPEAYTPREVLTYWHSAQGQRFVDALEFAAVSLREPPAWYAAVWQAGKAQRLRAESEWEVRLVDANIGRIPAGRLSWKANRAREAFEFALPERADSADLLIWPGDAPVRLELRGASTSWIEVAASKRREPVDLRRDATAYLRRSGYRYLLMSSDRDACAAVAKAMAAEPEAWGVRIAARTDASYLFEIF